MQPNNTDNPESLEGQDDAAAFLAEMSDVQPLITEATVMLKTDDPLALSRQLKREQLQQDTHPTLLALSLELIRAIDPYDFISYKQDGIQEGVFKNLRLGKYPIEARLTLTQSTIEVAREALFNKITLCFKQGTRVLLVQHGMGLNSKPVAGKLKSYLNMWLPEFAEVIAYHSAHVSHGGLAATYVLLKKNPEQKLINREKHAKRG